MSTEYFSPGEPTPEFDLITTERKNELNTELNDHTTHFLDTLRNLRDPDLERHIFAFHGEVLERALYLPRVLHDVVKRYGQIDEVAVTTSHITTGGDTRADLAITIEFYSEVADESYYLFIERINGVEPKLTDHDKLYSETGYQHGVVEDEVQAMNNHELNRMIASLIHNSPATHVSKYDSEAWLTTTYGHLADSLSDAASSYNAHSEYGLVDEDGGHAGLIEIEEAEGTVIETSLYMVDAYNIDISPDGNLGYVENGTEVCIENVTDDPETLFVQHKSIDESHTVSDFEPTDDDYTATLEFMQHHGKLQRSLHGKK